MKTYEEKECSKLGFFRSENAERYKEYASKNSHMDGEEVVWRVNNHLDKEKYAYDVPVSDGNSLFVLVNKYFKLPDDYCPSDLVEADGLPMRSITADAYRRMRDAAKAEGFSVSVSSAYRSIDEQKQLYNKFLKDAPASEVDKTCARPGYSEHHTGLAIDVQGSIPGGRNIAKTPEGPWVRENCHKFGFILRYLPEIVEITGYDAEPWHLRYVGETVSMDMKAKQIKSFEEYRERFLIGKDI